jgi:hypothetical protein
MNEYMIFMHNDASDTAAADDGERWGAYLMHLRQSGCFDGGSSLGIGEELKKGQSSRPAGTALTGFIRIRAETLEDAKRFLVGNPTYEAGGTVEVRELVRD